MPKINYQIRETSRNWTDGTIIFGVFLMPAPPDEWLAVFRDFTSAEQAIGTIIDVRIAGNRIDLEVPASIDPAVAIRRCLDRTNERRACP